MNAPHYLLNNLKDKQFRSLISVKDDRTPDNRPIRYIMLSNPKYRNRLSVRVMLELRAAIVQVPKSIIMIEGSFRERKANKKTEKVWAFSSGLNQYELLLAISTDGTVRTPLRCLVGLYEDLVNHDSPTAALMNGAAQGGGVGLALCTDVVVAHSDATLEVPGHGYLALAKVLMPIIARRRADVTIDEILGKKLTASQANGFKMVENVADSRAKMRDLALNELDSKSRFRPLIADLEASREAYEVACTPIVSEIIGWQLRDDLLKSQARTKD